MFTGCKFGAVHAKAFVYTAIVVKGENWYIRILHVQQLIVFDNVLQYTNIMVFPIIDIVIT